MQSRKRGFTLLEVMVAIAILGLSLTMILAAQAGALSNAAQARNISQAAGLLRCKMSELEEQIKIARGFPALDEADSGPCCEGDESRMRCTWKIEKPEFPDPKYGDLDLDSDLGSSGLSSLGPLAQGMTGGSNPLGQNASVGDVAQQLGGADGAAGALSGMLGTVMQMVYPDIKMIFEASTRRLTVKVTWMEGIREREIEIAQWYTIPQRGTAIDLGNMLGGAAGAGNPTSPSTGSGAGTGR
ncbi:type IV pilus modification PilV family protein [Chondromyces crocatus]|uniref:General secretion pathway protein GspI n=1 Tax=Chondromyces crocatus TaxID=52 RepID=A0A0K1E7Q5_CHOCO|nr:type II secretion system protein [Chondromyces crocatus]AKT36712.1 general secretion pathway protein GspI [Chondromyces crocatus]